MLYHLSIHRPQPEHEAALIYSMHRFGRAASSQPGLLEAHTLKDRSSGTFVGLAIWESEEALGAARPALAAAVADDDFDTWEIEPPAVFLLEEV